MAGTRLSPVFPGPSGERAGRILEVLSDTDTSDVDREFLLFDALLKEARDLGIIPRKNPLEDLALPALDKDTGIRLELIFSAAPFP